MGIESTDYREEQQAGSGIRARIIPESDHPIRPGDLDREALKVLYRLRDAGFSGYLVGGGVRDLYLGKQPKDFDISTNARPGQLRRLFRNSRTIGRRFRLVQVFFRGNKIIEVSTLRSQSEYGRDDTKVLPANNTFGTLEEDAFRRDLTINSLFYEIGANTIIDYVGGVTDLNNGIIRIVGDPDVRITRDPVRILRALRHAARTGFTIDEQSFRAIVTHRDKLNLCPSSRIRDEIIKDLVSGFSRPWAELCIRSRVFFTLFPFYDQPAGDRNGLAEIDAIFRVVDRLQKNGNNGPMHLPDYMLMALLLYPWLQRELHLLRRDVRGGGYRRLFNDIRQALDASICGRLNIKRSGKEAMTTLFVNMPRIYRHQEQRDWPKWLKKKSYFQDCARFCAIIAEAGGGAAVNTDLFAAPVRPAEARCAGRHGHGGGRGGNPSFTEKKGGVFGLRTNSFPVG
ncbi:MAG: polya polymerase [Desulfobulbus sp.]|nr:MAG: polya polymerase [Desulfobulbus sp.]